jgi:hypothetical protein
VRAIVCPAELELELIQTQMAQEPMLREVSARACVARELKREKSLGVGGRAMRLMGGGAWVRAGVEGTRMGWNDL